MSDVPTFNTLKFSEPAKETESPGTVVIEDEGETNYGPLEIIKVTGLPLVIISAVVSGALAFASAYFFHVPEAFYPAVAALGLGIGALAAIDYKTRTVKDEHNIVLAIVTVGLTIYGASQTEWFTLLTGGIGVIVCFGTFFALIFLTHFGSGGDIKLSPIPAFVLGAINPLAGVAWLFVAMIITGISLIIAIKTQKMLWHLPGFALSIPITLAIVPALYSLANLPYWT